MSFVFPNTFKLLSRRVDKIGVLGYFQTRAAKRRDSSTVASTEDTLHPHRTVRGERVAIIDDEEVMTSVTSAVLQRLGYSTISYSSAARFVKAFNADPEHVDLVVSDVVMPGISGVQLVRLLRDDGHDVPILLMTGYSVQARLEPGGGAGRISFVRKPFTPVHLAQSVRRLLSSSR